MRRIGEGKPPATAFTSCYIQQTDLRVLLTSAQNGRIPYANAVIRCHFASGIRPVLTIIPDKHKMTYRSARECLIPRAFLMLNWMGNRYEKRSG